MPFDRVPAAPRGAARGLAWAGTLLGAGLAVALALILLVGVFAGPVTGTAADGVHVSLRTPDDTAFDPLAERSVVYAADGSVLAVLHAEFDRRVVDIERVPEHVRHAVLAAEDRHFYEHDGFDVGGIGRAAIANLQAQGIQQGGSTITQQLAKQNFVGAEQTIQRKFSELLHAVALEEELSKDELLERYLNQVYFGAGAYGVHAAAEEYFRVEPEELTVEQAALLAALIRSPGSLEPRENPEGARSRRNQVLSAMGVEGYLDEAEAERAQTTALEVADPLERETTEPYAVEAVKREFLANPAFGETRGERSDALYTGGLRIHTTVDPVLQDLASDVVAAHEAELDGPTAAIAAVHPRDGRVVALHAGTDFDLEQFDLATQGRRQPGSAFKPFVAAAALERGFPPDLLLKGDSPAFFDDVTGWSEEDDGVRNYGDASFGPIDLREAVTRSVNTAFAQLILAVGPEAVVDVTERAGIDVAAALGENPGPAIALGGVANGVTPLEMATAYATFASGGMRPDPYLIDRVEDVGGEVRFEQQPDPERAMDPAVGAGVTDALQDVVRDGTGTGAQLDGWSPAGKTGTTQSNADAWFVGYVPVLSTAVWVGHPEGQVEMPGMTGGSLPTTIWQEFMGEALEGVDPVAFDHDGELEDLFEGETTEVPDVRGMDEDEALQALLEARLVADVQQVDDHAPAGEVVWQSPGPEATRDVGARLQLGVSTGTPPPPPEPEPEPDPTPEPEPAPEREPDPEPEPDPEAAEDEPSDDEAPEEESEEEAAEEDADDETPEDPADDEAPEDPADDEAPEDSADDETPEDSAEDEAQDQAPDDEADGGGNDADGEQSGNGGDGSGDGETEDGETEDGETEDGETGDDDADESDDEAPEDG